MIMSQILTSFRCPSPPLAALTNGLTNQAASNSYLIAVDNMLQYFYNQNPMLCYDKISRQ